MTDKRQPRPKMVDRVCACGCGATFQARAADIKRGWGKYASKACKARMQARKGLPAGLARKLRPFDRRERDDSDEIGHPMASGYFGHGQE